MPIDSGAVTLYRYSQWDGTEDLPDVNPEDLMEQLAENLMSYSDLQYALRMMQQGGLRSGQGRRPGIQDLLQKLRQLRREQLDRYSLTSLMEDIQQRLEQVVSKEREGIDRRVQTVKDDSSEGPEGLSPEERERLRQQLQAMAAKRREFLDGLPNEAPGAIRELSQYDFLDNEARQEFQELLEMLQKALLDSFAKSLQERVQGMQPAEKERLRRMAEELNRLLDEKMAGGTPDFDRFMEEFGDYFQGLNPSSLDDLVEKMQRQLAAMQSLLDSLPAESRQSLQDLLNAQLVDPQLQAQLARLAAKLEALAPMRGSRRQYPFHGDESLTLDEAMRLMEQLQQVDELEKQMERTRMGADLDTIDEERLRALLGDEAVEELRQIKDLMAALEKAGYVQQRGDRYELTARGIRRIGQQALDEIFTELRRGRLGPHPADRAGVGPDSRSDTKPYEFGDPFHLDLVRTIMNALRRETTRPPVRLKGDDFEVHRTEEVTSAAIVLMLDLSWSMVLRGNFLPAKKVALALDNLMRTQFPKDTLYVVGFSDYARELKGENLPFLSSHEAVYGTNMQHGFMVAQRLLSRHQGSNKQIIMITDGEPTAYIENGQSYFEYPPTPIIFRETLREVRRCTQRGIVINTFMLDRSDYLKEFITRLSRMNRGRAFYTSADRLGHYILVDYLTGRRKRVA